MFSLKSPHSSLWGSRIARIGAANVGLPGDLRTHVANQLQALILSLGGLVFLFLVLTILGPHLFWRDLSVSLTGLYAINVSLLFLCAVLHLVVRHVEMEPVRLINLGLVFQVVFCFGMSLEELMRPNAPGRLVEGLSFVAVLIVLFPMFIPATMKKCLLTAHASATTGPIAVLLYYWAQGEPLPDGGKILLGYIPNYIVVGLVIRTALLTRRLNRAESQARHMGSYQLEEPLGQGGMGEVWRASHRMLRRPAAIKLISPKALGASGSSDANNLQLRFEREAQATAELHSAHSIQLYDFGLTEDGTFFYVMELLDGLSLRELVEKYGPLPADRCTHILCQACDSLWDAHQSQLIHRDIKPANIYVCRYGHRLDYVKVLDFGLVKHSDGGKAKEISLTNVQGIPGTPAFIAPETLQGRATDARADIYALGCVAYWMLTGQLVFERDTGLQMALAHVQEAPLPPSRVTEIEIPAELERIVLHCLEKDPENRPQSIKELWEALLACGCKETWTAQYAGEWWSTHRP